MLENVKKLYKEIEVLKVCIEDIQNNCLHENIIKKYYGDTGNYDPNDDSYYTDFHCLDCNKSWTEEGSK